LLAGQLLLDDYLAVVIESNQAEPGCVCAARSSPIAQAISGPSWKCEREGIGATVARLSPTGRLPRIRAAVLTKPLPSTRHRTILAPLAELVRTWQERSSGLTAQFPQTDLLGAMLLAAQAFDHPAADCKQVLMIFSDMRQSTHVLDLERPTVLEGHHRSKSTRRS
jgi:hypothetical protein